MLSDRHADLYREVRRKPLTDTYTGINPAAVQRQFQALTTELLTITTSKAGPKTKATVATPATRASTNESTNQSSRAS